MTAFASAVPNVLRGSQRPTLLHLPSGTPVQVEDALYLLGEWGMGLDEWQQFVLRGALLERPDGRWAAKEVGVEVARQNGKGELLEARALLGLFLLDERLLVHSAHEFATASEALDRMDDRIDRNPQLKRLCKPTKRSHGEEGIYRRDGAKLRYRTRTKRGGRGFTADWLGLDEAMFIAESFHGSLMPTVSAVPNPQIWYTGSAVDREIMEDGVVFARVRARALKGDDDRLAYFGWGAPFDRPSDVPVEAAVDPSMWALGNPALAVRIDPEHVALEQRSMDPRTFAVERMGVGDWPSVDGVVEAVLSLDAWRACLDPTSAPVGPVCLAFDVTPDRSAAAICAAGRREDERWHVEVVDHARGTGWVVDRLEALVDRHAPVAVVCDGAGPAASLLSALANAGVDVETVTAQEHGRAFGSFVDAVGDGDIRHLGSPEMTAAIRGAAKRPLGDAWAWSRKKSSVDISPLVASTLARWGVENFALSGALVEVF